MVIWQSNFRVDVDHCEILVLKLISYRIFNITKFLKSTDLKKDFSKQRSTHPMSERWLSKRWDSRGRLTVTGMRDVRALTEYGKLALVSRRQPE